MIHPKISVIMAAYNTEKYIAQSIESILNQSFKDFELIIIDDKSTDQTRNIVSEYAKRDIRIVILNNKYNSGVSATRNNGLKIARGEYIAIQDADDISELSRLQIQYDFLQLHPSIFLTGSSVTLFNNLNETIGYSTPILNQSRLKQNLLKKNCIYHSTIFFRNKGYLYREKLRYGEDYDLFLRLLSVNLGIKCLKHKLVKYRVHTQSITRLNGGHTALFDLQIKKFYRQRLELGVDDYDNFDPNSILSVNQDSVDKDYLLGEIDSSMKILNFKRVRTLVKSYIKLYGLTAKVLAFYVVSLLGKRVYYALRYLRNYFAHL